MASDVTDDLRRKVTECADYRCEYCLLPQSVALHKHEIDHVIPSQHGGQTEESNLALSCMRCNRHKGHNVGSFDPESGALVSFFNPRIRSWEDRFALEKAIIHPLTAEGRVTVKIFGMNQMERVTERKSLLKLRLH